jgi:hypothetical protein
MDTVVAGMAGDAMIGTPWSPPSLPVSRRPRRQGRPDQVAALLTPKPFTVFETAEIEQSIAMPAAPAVLGRMLGMALQRP